MIENEKNANIKIDLWSPLMMFTDQKLYKILKKKLWKWVKNAKIAQTGPKTEKWAVFQKGLSEIF